MNDALQFLCRRAEVKDHVIEQAELLALDQADLKVIHSFKLIRRISNAQSMRCDDCGNSHLVDVVQDPRRRGHFYYHCPEIGRIKVRPDRLWRWEVAFDQVSRALRAALSLQGDHLEIVPGRIWLLGRRRHGKVTAEVFLVRGSWWSDANDVLDSAERLQQSPDPLVFVPKRFPSSTVWLGRRGSLHSLAENAEIRGQALALQEDVIDDVRLRRVPFFSESSGGSTPDGKLAGRVPRSIGSPASVRVVAQYMEGKGLDHAGFAKKVGTTGRTIQKFLSEGTVLRRIFNNIAAFFKLSTEELLQGVSPRRTL